MKNSHIYPFPKDECIDSCAYNINLLLVNKAIVEGFTKSPRLVHFNNKKEESAFIHAYNPPISFETDEKGHLYAILFPNMVELDETEKDLISATLWYHIAKICKTKKPSRVWVRSKFIRECLKELGYTIEGECLIYEGRK